MMNEINFPRDISNGLIRGSKKEAFVRFKYIPKLKGILEIIIK